MLLLLTIKIEIVESLGNVGDFLLIHSVFFILGFFLLGVFGLIGVCCLLEHKVSHGTLEVIFCCTLWELVWSKVGEICEHLVHHAKLRTEYHIYSTLA